MVGLFNSTFCLKIVAQDTTNFYNKVIFFTLLKKNCRSIATSKIPLTINISGNLQVSGNDK